MKKLIVIIGVGLLVGALYLAYLKVFTVAYPVMPDNVRHEIVKRMDSEGIWYREEPNGVLRVRKGSEQKIIEFGELESEQIIPMGRSFSPAPDLLEETELKLKKKGVPYELRKMDGLTWIVLGEEYEGRVEEIWLEGI